MDQYEEPKVSRIYSNTPQVTSGDEMDLRRGPWTVEEDFTLINYIAHHGEGRWNSLARCAGLRRTGKSCRLRWLNYLRPDVRRGNITLEEQLLILELHSRWGNRWSKIAQYLPGRTDNEIKNYWRTRVQKHAKQLKCDVNSKQFKDSMRYLWMPRLVEKIQASAAPGRVRSSGPVAQIASPSSTTGSYQWTDFQSSTNLEMDSAQIILPKPNINGDIKSELSFQNQFTLIQENSSTAASSESFGTSVLDLTDNYPVNNYYPGPINNNNQVYGDQCLTSPTGYFYNEGLDFVEQNNQWMDGGDLSDGLWNVDDVWYLQQKFNNNV